MANGLFTSIYGKAGDGIFGTGLFSRKGSTPSYTSADLRLGGLGQEDDEEDEDEDEGASTTIAPAAKPTAARPAAMTRVPKESVFAKQIAGFPLWLIGVTFLGFSWALRKRRSKQ